MNEARMQARGLSYTRVLAGSLPGLALAFNKQAADAPYRSYANVVYAPESKVEGVLYELCDADEIYKMDPFEGTPRLYSREIYFIHTAEGAIASWVYVANAALLKEGLKPETWYMRHLLEGQPYLSDDYYQQLCDVECLDHASPVVPPDCLGRNS